MRSKDTEFAAVKLPRCPGKRVKGYWYFNQDRVEGRFQKRYELMLKRREEAAIHHGHCNNRQTILYLQAKGIQLKYLKGYILAHRCDVCEAAPGHRHHTVQAKHKLISTPSISTIVAPATTPATKPSNPLTENLDLEFSTIIDAVNPTVTITESLTHLFQHTSNNPYD